MSNRFQMALTAVAFVTYFDDGSRKFIFHFGNTPAVWGKFSGTEDIGQPAFFHVMGCSLMASDARGSGTSISHRGNRRN
jgi:hypothetical protein